MPFDCVLKLGVTLETSPPVSNEARPVFAAAVHLLTHPLATLLGEQDPGQNRASKSTIRSAKQIQRPSCWNSACSRGSWTAQKEPYAACHRKKPFQQQVGGVKKAQNLSFRQGSTTEQELCTLCVRYCN